MSKRKQWKGKIHLHFNHRTWYLWKLLLYDNLLLFRWQKALVIRRKGKKLTG